MKKNEGAELFIEDTTLENEWSVGDLKKSQIYLNAIQTSYNYMAIYNLTQNAYQVSVSDDVMKWHNPSAGNYEELLDRLIALFPEDKRDEMRKSRSIRNQLDRYYAGEKYFAERIQMYDGDGCLHWIDERVMYTEDPESGDILGVSLSSVVDNEVKNAKAVTQIATALSRDYLNVYLIKPQADEQTAVSLNGYLMPTMNQRLGVTVSYYKMITTYLNERVCEEDRERLFEHLRAENIEQTMVGKTEIVLPYHIIENGEIHDYEVKVIRTAEAGTYIYGFKNIDDTMAEERRKQRLYEEALAAAERASHAKSDFLSRMSHDIRTPMNIIVGLLYILKQNKTDPEVVSEVIEKLEMTSSQLRMLLDDVLDMSRLENKREVIAHEPFDIRKQIDSCLYFMDTQAKEYTVHIHSSIDGTEHTKVIGSPVHYERVMMNIISNAIKYNKPDGRIDVCLAEEPVNEQRSDFVLTIADTGIGISQEFLDRIYEPFEQENAQLATQYKGTGLGMAITKELVEMMDGTISISSVKGSGTTVVIRIPFLLDQSAPEEVASEPIDEISLKGSHILLAEDNKLNRRVAVYMLEEAGAIVTATTNGLEALEQFEEKPEGSFDLILMDIRMPVMDGIRATRIIRNMARADAGQIPIIALSANAFLEDIRECKEAGMNDHVAKPIDVEKLCAVIRKYIN